MAAEAPTNNCLADIASANGTLSDILTLPSTLFGSGGGSSSDSCTFSSSSPPSYTYIIRTAIDKFQTAYNSINLSFDIPSHPKFLGDSAIAIESNNAFSGKYTVELPQVEYLIGVQLAVTVSVMFGVLFATIIYHTLLSCNNTNTNNCNQKNLNSYDKTKQEAAASASTTVQFHQKVLIGSTILPLCILLPYILISLSGVQHTSVRFVILSFFVLNLFRTLEAIFDFVPNGAKTNGWGVYCAYFALPFDMLFDNEENDDEKKGSKPVMATTRDVVNGSVNVIKALACIVVLCSILSPFGYKPFGETDAGEFHETIVLKEYLDVRHLGNCFAIALLFQQALYLGDSVIGNAIQTTLGYKSRQSMHNPMLEATSPSDFWGRRWNVLVHAVMKRGVYKPVRKYTGSAVLASLAVFTASGLFHEWFVHAVLMYNQPMEVSSGVLLGSNTAFFLWNFVVIVSERVLAGMNGFKSFGKMIPGVFVPFLIIMTSLPMAHWFGSPYLNGNYFGDYEKCLFLIRKV